MQCSKINTHPSKCMILLECLTDHLVPESSPTPSHSPKPRMRIIMFVCVQPFDVYIYIYIYIYISIGPSPTIDIISGLPSNVYQLGRLRRLIFFSMDYPPIIIIFSFRQPSETIFSGLISYTQSYSFRVFQCIWNACMSIPIHSNSHVNI